MKVCALPNSSEADAGVMVTLMEDGVGVGVGGGWTTAETPLQPTAHTTVPRRTRTESAGRYGCDARCWLLTAFGEMGRMQQRRQAKGQGKKQARVRRRKRGASESGDCKLLELRVLGQVLARTGSSASALSGSSGDEIRIVGYRFETVLKEAVPFVNCVPAEVQVSVGDLC
jgi:hypothetical protein